MALYDEMSDNEIYDSESDERESNERENEDEELRYESMVEIARSRHDDNKGRMKYTVLSLNDIGERLHQGLNLTPVCPYLGFLHLKYVQVSNLHVRHNLQLILKNVNMTGRFEN